ncbi:uncharacterized protein ASCRUDRAFT_68950 [Ascoidea rubescens DSM 1968]|uniref:PH domain-containing protein n=1 Tax=Ascoidea rubescens DSM 1968 TaxID=1344418 RepID=A0A1D2VNN7_9ASCO|nr:hypothetical protein ASCRUDRAFT_68950 [Ascoidea rubescens DSM 1968]ODV63187.1 hypothetical protein ASCRUDRAFT_68950 [Ascoidea rubescens DSM 1968]
MSAAAVDSSTPTVQHDLINETLPDVSSILVTRLDHWIHAIELLVNYSEGYIYLAEKISEGFEKIKKNLTQQPQFPVHTVEGSNNSSDTDVYNSSGINANRNANGNGELDNISSTGDHLKGIYGLFELLKLKNNDNIIQTHGLEQLLRSIVPELKKTINDIQIEKKKIIHDNLTYLKDYDKYKKKSTHESNKLNEIILQLKDSNRSLNDFENDPYLLKKHLLKTSSSFISIENSLIDSFIKTIRNFKNFESNFIVNNIKTNLISLTQYILKFSSLFDANLKNIINEFSLLDNQFEWDYFISPNNVNNLSLITSGSLDLDSNSTPNTNTNTNTNSNSNDELANSRLISNNSEALNLLLNVDALAESEVIIDRNIRKTIDNTVFPNKDNPLTIPIIENELNYKRVSNLKSDHLKSSYFVVTRSKYLINFKDKYHFGDPEFVFYLPDCTLNASIQDYKHQTTTIRVPSQGSYSSENDGSPTYLGDESAPAEITRSKSKSIKNTFSRKFSKKKKYIKEVEYKFQIKGADCNKSFLTKFSSHKKLIELKFASKEDMLIWYNVLKEATGLLQTEAEREDEEEIEDTLQINPIVVNDPNAPLERVEENQQKGAILETDERAEPVQNTTPPPVPERVSETAPEPTPEPVTKPTPQPVVQSTKPAFNPAPEPVTQPIREPTLEPKVQESPIQPANQIERPPGPPPNKSAQSVKASAPGAWVPPATITS